MSVETANFLSFWGNWILLAALIVGAVSTGVVIVAGVVKDQAFERYKLSVAGQVAEAKKAGIEAGEKAGDADLHAAKANERAAGFEKEAQELKAANLVLEAQIQPRRLSGESAAKLESALSKMHHLPIGIVSRLFDPEGADFADDLANVFNKSGWQAVRQRDWTMSDRGVAVATFEGTPLPPELAKTLIAALADAGIKMRETTVSSTNQNTTSAHFQPHALYLLVGAKP